MNLSYWSKLLKSAESLRGGNGTAFLLRTNNFGIPVRALARRLSTFLEAPITVVCDESGGPIEVNDFGKISLTPESLQKLGIGKLPNNWGWFCGDFCYYAAKQEMPGFEYYCLIESDVFFSDSAVKAFKSILDNSNAEVLVAQLGPKPKKQKYSKGLGPLGLDPNWGCIFPVSRVHSSVIPKMLELRNRNEDSPPKYLLNDEAVLAGATYENDFSYVDLSDKYPRLFSESSFSTNPPHLYEALINNSSDLRVFHPVVQFKTIMDRINSGEKNYTRFRLRKVFEHATTKMKKDMKQALKSKNEM